MDRWTDKVFLVTGASSGIGRSIVVELSKYPLKIVALARRIDLLQELANELKLSAAEIFPVQCDLTCEQDILKAFEWIESTVGHGISVLINNAGILIKTRILDGEINDWKNMFDLNVLALSICCKETYKSMKKHGIDNGHIININSTAGHTTLPFPGQKIYNSSKTAVTYLTEGFRHELAFEGSKIKMTSISPGNVNTGNKAENSNSVVLSMKPERVAHMTILALTTPPDVVIAELTVLSVGETIHAYPPPMIR